VIARLHGIGLTEVRMCETAEKIFAIAEKTLVIVGGIGVPTKEISRVTGDSGVIIKEISERIVEFAGTTNDIIPQGRIAGTDTLPNVTDIHIPPDLTEEEAGAKLTDVRFFPVFSGCQKNVAVFKRFFLKPLIPHYG
jgi:hypothetical protein